MHASRLRADEEQLCDLLVRMPGSDKSEDLDLADRQAELFGAAIRGSLGD